MIDLDDICHKSPNNTSATLDNENGRSLIFLYSSDVHHKGPLYLKGSVSCGIKHFSVYHAYLHTIQLAKQ